MKISIIGCGSWGVALASVLSDNGNDVLMLSRHQEEVDEINITHTLEKYAPNKLLNESIMATTEYDELINYSKIIVLVVPSKAVKDVTEILKKFDLRNGLLIIATKGLINKSTISSYLERELNSKENKIEIGVLSGPSFSSCVLDKKVTCVDSASMHESVARKIQELFNNNYFRVYLSTDINGVEFCGSFKNVIALGAGILEGSNQGPNAKAALISRGLYEMSKYKKAFGIKQETLYGLAGIGDLVLTATDMTSRNYSLGYYLGKGLNLDDALEKVKTTAESIVTVKDLYEIAKDNEIDSPIIKTIYEVVYDNKSLDKELEILMSRTLKHDI